MADMREILFRGKRTYDGEWKQGDLIHLPTGTAILANGYAIIDPGTVGQYTGLTDKNGAKIFEGDIVKYGDTIHRVIFEQRNKTAYFGLTYSPIETLPFGHYQDSKQIEVIGNVFDNSELLEERGGRADNG